MIIPPRGDIKEKNPTVLKIRQTEREGSAIITRVLGLVPVIEKKH